MTGLILGVFDSPLDIGIVVLIVVLLFGSSQLPKLARSLGMAQKEFRKGVEEGDGQGPGHLETPSNVPPGAENKGS